jgi:hypothetical protein
MLQGERDVKMHRGAFPIERPLLLSGGPHRLYTQTLFSSYLETYYGSNTNGNTSIVLRGGMTWSGAMHRAASLSLAVAIGWTASNMWMNCSRQASQTFPHRAPSNPWQDDECFSRVKPFSQALWCIANPLPTKHMHALWPRSTP